MTSTIQNREIVLRDSVTTADTPLDGVTSALTYQWTDKPAEAKDFGPEANAIDVFFSGTDAENDTFSWKLYAWPEGGPAKHIANGTGILGAAKASATEYYADTLTITEQDWFKTVVARDIGNDRIAHLAVWLCGYKYLYCELTSIAGGGIQANSITVYVKTF